MLTRSRVRLQTKDQNLLPGAPCPLRYGRPLLRGLSSSRATPLRSFASALPFPVHITRVQRPNAYSTQQQGGRNPPGQLDPGTSRALMTTPPDKVSPTTFPTPLRARCQSGHICHSAGGCHATIPPIFTPPFACHHKSAAHRPAQPLTSACLGLICNR